MQFWDTGGYIRLKNIKANWNFRQYYEYGFRRNPLDAKPPADFVL